MLRDQFKRTRILLKSTNYKESKNKYLFFNKLAVEIGLFTPLRIIQRYWGKKYKHSVRPKTPALTWTEKKRCTII